MTSIFLLASIVFYLWVIFLGGAERLQDSLIGYLEFGNDSPKYMRYAAWVSLILTLFCLLS